jgi:hypothetical protein
VSVPVLERVRVLLINGSDKSVSRVTNVTLDLSPEAVAFIETNRKYMMGDMFITKHTNAMPSAFGAEVSDEAKTFIRDNVGMAAEKGK